MREEVCAAVKFFACFVEKSEKVPREQLSNFEKHLTDLLIERFEKHWFPDLPSKGQGYRCIRVNCVSPVDLTLERAASKSGLRYKDLKLPTELTVWVDPSEVCYRLGESEGSYCTLASFPQSDTSSASSSNPPSTSSSPRPQSPMLHSPMLSPIIGGSTAVQMARRHQQRSHQSLTGRSPPNYPTSGFDYGSPKFATRNQQQQQQQGFVGTRPNNRLSQREMNFAFSHPPPPAPPRMYHHHQRCDGPPYPMATPPFYRHTNRNYHKNVLRV